MIGLILIGYSPTITDNDGLFYRLDTGELFPNEEVIHLRGLSTNGYKGKSPIAVHRDNLAHSVSAQLYGRRLFDQGGNMSGVFKYPSTLKPETYQRLKKHLIAQSVGWHNAHVPLLLEDGMTYERISIPPKDARNGDSKILFRRSGTVLTIFRRLAVSGYEKAFPRGGETECGSSNGRLKCGKAGRK